MKSKFLAYSTLAFCLTTVIPLSAKAMPIVPPVEVSQATAQLTEADVQVVIDRLQTARNNRDVEGTLELIAPFAVTVVTVEAGNGLSTVTTRLEGMNDHRQMLEQTFSQVQTRESLRNYVTIDMIDDNFGIAKIYQMENLATTAGDTWIAASQTVLRLGRVDGQVLVTSATVDGWISARPSQD
ncbi:hypothetical protein PGN35_006505 [Nodosilinea sp. PGN35]|uniref:hypothetical protein n=1 Tax=Nodosilinea sp. PGN35 TaxID=3020489 RepID=UPI0023B2BEC0|nr:hypothetical protein [Nodosilinea sp. TSF1-S3]MDF0366049.1 hypothetical protein [Nodosilinea sp. TSF1-S3]